jgi:hypothetical protein
MDAGRICPEDVVCLVSDPCMPGMVCCVGEDTENRHAQPSAHVYWLRENDNDRMEPISELRILDRALLHGDTGLICHCDSTASRLVGVQSRCLRARSKQSCKLNLIFTERCSAVVHGKRKGLVSSTKIMVDLRYGDGVIIHNIDTKRLKHLQPFRLMISSTTLASYFAFNVHRCCASGLNVLLY